MKTTIILRFTTIILFAAMLSTMGCSKDDDCTIQDWVGSYTLTDNCIAAAAATTISIDSDGDLEVEVAAGADFFILKETELDGCKAVSEAGSSPSFNLTLSGGNITGTIESCEVTITRN